MLQVVVTCHSLEFQHPNFQSLCNFVIKTYSDPDRPDMDDCKPDKSTKFISETYATGRRIINLNKILKHNFMSVTVFSINNFRLLLYHSDIDQVIYI